MSEDVLDGHKVKDQRYPHSKTTFLFSRKDMEKTLRSIYIFNPNLEHKNKSYIIYMPL